MKFLKPPSSELAEPENITFSIVALSYRGFWTSKGRPSEKGIGLDAQAALQWIFNKYDLSKTKLVIWGQSIGAGVATTALAELLESEKDQKKLDAVRGMVLETPFVNLRSMLVALYPQKFLPYRYLHPFLLSTWDSGTALKRIITAGNMPRTLILEAGKDEIVPAGQAEILEQICMNGGGVCERKVVNGSLHTEVLARNEGRRLIAKFLRTFAQER